MTLTHALPVLPLVIPLTAAVAVYAIPQERVPPAARLIGVVLHLCASLALAVHAWREGMVVTAIGGWPPGIAIALVADLLSATMLVTAAIVALAVGLYAMPARNVPAREPGFVPLFYLLLAGVSGAFLTGDLFNLYVWFELTLIASFVLIALGSDRHQVEGAVKYVALNLVATALLLSGIGVLYGLTGTVNLAGLSERLSQAGPGVTASGATAATMLIVIAFAIKAGAVPFSFWLPASYHTPPAAVAALFAGLLSQLGVYAVLRVSALLLAGANDPVLRLLLVLAGASMLVGVIGALAQHEFRRLLAFHSVSQIGYLLMGVGLLTTQALAGVVFFLVHYMIVNAALFLAGGLAERVRGTSELGELGGLRRSHPAIASLFAIAALALVGVPPLSGFFAKFMLLRAGLEAEAYVVTGIALAVSLLTMLSMVKVWREAFWRPAPSAARARAGNLDRPADATAPTPPANVRIPALSRAGAGLLVAAAITVGLGAGPVARLSLDAAAQLTDRGTYVVAVTEAAR